MYSKKIIDRFVKAKNSGLLKGASGVGLLVDEKSAQTIKLYIKVEDEVIVDSKFKVFGCVATISIMDAFVDLIKGKTIEQSLDVSKDDILYLVGNIPCESELYLSFAHEVLNLAIINFRKKQEKLLKKLEESMKD